LPALPRHLLRARTTTLGGVVTAMLRVLSLGAGVQSTTLALMAAAGEIGPMPDFAIFADTGWEPRAVYDHLDRLEPMLPFPVVRVSAGDLRADIMAKRNTTGGRLAAVPWFLRMPDGGDGIGRRQCTAEYKLAPIQRRVRQLLGGKTPKGGCEMWVGISRDEAHRMKPSRVGYISNRWPLIERDMTRADCQAWLRRHVDMEPPKSACVGCPYHSAARWRAIRADPVAWADVLEVDAAIRNQPGFRGQQFMHPARVPIAEVDLRSWADRGQGDLFGEECEGMCGT